MDLGICPVAAADLANNGMWGKGMWGKPGT
jgi:hypothetical protein